jgi:uroporphyrinogen decarboxylase
MNHRERVLTALNLGIPDKVPYIELEVDEEMGKKLLNRKEPIYNGLSPLDGFNPWFCFIGRNYYNPIELCEKLHLDGWGYSFMPQIYAEEKEANTSHGKRTYITEGLIKNKDDLKKIKLADLKDNSIFEYVNDYINEYRKDYAVFAVTNMGTDPMLFSLGWETFSYALVDDISLIEEILDIYNEWLIEATKKLCELNFDFIFYADDIAYKNGIMFSPDFYREICMPRLRKVVNACTKPCIYHTDGDFLEVIEELLSLGLNGLHPIEPLSVDIFNFKKKYGTRVCTVGNIDINKLSLGSKEEVYDEVKHKVKELSMGGSYIMSSSNTLTLYCNVENVKAMVEAFERFR